MEELEGLYEASVRSVGGNTLTAATKPSEVASTFRQGEQMMTTMKRAREEKGEEEETKDKVFKNK